MLFPTRFCPLSTTVAPGEDVIGIEGIVFAVLWASASIAAKIGFKNAKPLTILDARFFLAAAVTLIIFQTGRERRPVKGEWRHVITLGFTNSAVYLGCSWVGLHHVTVGLYGLFVAVNPFLVAIMSRVVLKRTIKPNQWFGMALSAAGLSLAIVPSIHTARADAFGIVLIAIAMVSYSVGTVYRTWSQTTLSPGVLNTWQITFGAFMILPFAIALNGPTMPNITWRLTGALLWSVFAVSVVANLMWFRLIAKDSVRASGFLFLTPIFGYIEAWAILGERVHWNDAAGAVVVFIGLAVAGTVQIGRRRALAPEPKADKTMTHA